MSTVAYSPTHPGIFPNIGTLQPGLGSAFRPNLNSWGGSIEDKAQLSQAYLESYAGAAGFGGIAGGSVTPGVGLSVVMGSVQAIVGNPVGIDTSSTVSGLTANAVNYLWLRQSGVFTASTAATAPGTTDGFGTALLWGQASTNASTVTAVIQPQRWLPLDHDIVGTVQAKYLGGAPLPGNPFGLLVGSVDTNSTADQTLGTSLYTCPYLRCQGTAIGTVTLFVPLQEGSMWWVNNAAGSCSVRLKISGQTGIVVGSAKHAMLGCGTADIERWTADA